MNTDRKQDSGEIIEIIVSKDRMEARVIIRAGSEPPVCLEDVLAKLHTMGIIYGIDEKAISCAIREAGDEFIVARGTPSQDGDNAYIRYLFNHKPDKAPVLREDGTADYKHLNWIVMVRQDEVLAEKVAATEGEDGFDVFGISIPPKPGRDVNIPVGKNVRIHDGWQAVAEVAGQYLVSGGKITVNPLLEIKGDVDMTTGNIEFNGSIVVRGSVQAGFFVGCNENIEIHGSVMGGSVSARNIVVRKGIIGAKDSLVAAKESLSTGFIENARVYAGGDIFVGDFILHSQVESAATIVVEGKRGLIGGGNAKARREIRAKIIGTSMATPTSIEVGILPGLRDEYKKLKAECSKQAKTVAEAEKALKILRAMEEKGMSQDKQAMLAKLTRTYFVMTNEIESMKKRMKEIEAVVEESKRGEVKVSGLVHPGVGITIGTVSRAVGENIKYARFFNDNGQIVIGSYA